MYGSSRFTLFELIIEKATTKPQCLTCRNIGVFKEIGCTVKTTRVVILLQLKYRMEPDYTVELIKIVIPDAVFDAKLEELVGDSGMSSTYALQLADLSVQNITSSINARRLSIPVAAVSVWKTWALSNCERILKVAFTRRGVVSIDGKYFPFEN
ncbi:unnamed protein product [Dibothriocephalus latus]|uniref:Uncharacterized protein n=1 Tax=Dibothriocephalus latus TaxID=60516 RepID=A0A3P7RNV1_DIBLA|nr:unnamed protein product [Dibothriocephalus latus]